MTKKVSKTTKNKSVSTQKTQAKKKTSKAKKGTKEITIVRKINPKVTKFIIVMFGLLLIASSYAWFSTNLNVKIRTFNMIVMKNGDLTISFDGINFARSIEITKEAVYKNLGDIYPTYNTQWPSNGLVPVSSPGLIDANSSRLPIFETNGVLYKRREPERGFVTVKAARENNPHEYSKYLAFDIFIKNETGSPVSDNLYLTSNTMMVAPEEDDEEMLGLINSFRLGIVRIGSVTHKATVDEIQNIQCENNCQAIIYEPNHMAHTDLSIERAKKYNVNLVNGTEFPTYAYTRAGGPIYLEKSVSGSKDMDYSYFKLQESITEDDFDAPIFQIPDGVTKFRIYLWIEGQDIDSLESDSKGTDVEISIDFNKDMAGYEAFDE